MKIIGVILAMIVVAFAVNNPDKAALVEEIKKQYAEMQTVIKKNK